MHIGVDLMGSDTSPVLLYQAVEQVAGCWPEVDFTIFATQEACDAILLQRCVVPARVQFKISPEVIAMDDDPIAAIRQKKASSLVLGLKLLKRRALDAFISAGNTGAFIAGATLTLPLLPGIKRPGLLANLPTEKGGAAIIDVGGNVSCQANHLVQFALMGAAYQTCCKGLMKPRVGLLNIGVESKKGTADIRQAYQLLQACPYAMGMEFIGNVEGRAVFEGVADVVVTNGFAGNVLLKAAEGISHFLLRQLQDHLAMIVPQEQETILAQLRRQFDDEEYSGALICGVDRIAVKCHGQSSPRGFFNAIQGMMRLVQRQLVEEMKRRLVSHF